MVKVGLISLLISTLVLISFIGITSGQNLRDREKQIKDQILGRTYDGTVLPRENGTGPVLVNVSVHLKNIFAVDENKMNLEMQILLRMQWNDNRLFYSLFPPNSGPNHLTLPESLMEKVWIPDVYITNAVKVESEKNSKYMRTFPNGDVHYSTLLTLTTACPMNLKYYPHDSPTCDLKISSYGYTSQDLIFKWKETIATTVDSKMLVRAFDLYKFDTDDCEAETKTGTYSCLKMEMFFSRKFSYYLVQVYIPCTMLVIVSWLSYWLHPIKSATARVIVSVSSLGLCTIGAVALNSKMSPVSYTKAIDTWTGMCLTFILLSLIEFVTVNYLNQYGKCVAPGKKQIPDSSETAEQQTPLHPSGDENKRRPSSSDVATGNKLGSAIDIIFRIVIPILFLLFIIIYWIVFV